MKSRAEHPQRNYRALLESLDGIVWESDLDFRITFLSAQADRVVGPRGGHGLAGVLWKDLIHPDDLDRVLAARRAAVEARRTHECEYRLLGADGRAVWVRDTVAVVFEKGRPVKLCGILVPIAERKDLEAQLHQASKMEAVGKLAGGIAHDFNNFLTIVTGYSELLLTRMSAADPLRPDVEEIKKAGSRAAALTQQLLAFSRRQVLMPKVLDLNAIIDGMSTMLQRLVGEDINLVTNLDRDIGRVNADPGQLEQVIMNLVVNARDAMSTGGKLTIESGRTRLAARGRLVQDLPPGPYVQVSVTDTGMGMDAATQARIFEPFFTTKERGKGTGLGLSTVYGIVKQSGGGLLVQSAPGKGSTFTVLLPEIEAEQDVLHEESEEIGPGGSETILLVEDEPGVRTLVRDTLSIHGYNVLEARHGIEALLVANQHAGTIHLLLTDVVMPQMSGRELSDQLRRVRTDLAVLYMSGYTENAVVQHGVLAPGTAFLHKPFTPDELAKTVRGVLDGVGVRKS